jgi:uncharacterized protein YggE
MESMKILQSQNRLLIYTLLLGFLACVVGSRTVLASEVHFAGQNISVNGSASASVEPNLVRVSFGVETQRESSSLALSENAPTRELFACLVRECPVDASGDLFFAGRRH